MSIAWRGGLAAGALTVVAALCGCEPTPSYGPLQPPYLGAILAEDSVITTGRAQQLGFLSSVSSGRNAVMVSLPAGAYAAGIQVTLRWVSYPGFATAESLQLGSFVGGEQSSSQDALQLLPPTPAPASPVTVALIGTGLSTFDVLYATACDADWQVAGTASSVPSTSSTSLSFPMSAPGFWTLGQKAIAMDAGTATQAHPYPADCPEVDGGQQD